MKDEHEEWTMGIVDRWGAVEQEYVGRLERGLERCTVGCSENINNNNNKI